MGPEVAPSPDDAPGGGRRYFPLPGHLNLWLWGVLGSPSPSGLSACRPAPRFCQGPQERTPRTFGWGEGAGLLCCCLWVTLKDTPPHTFGMRALLCLSPSPCPPCMLQWVSLLTLLPPLPCATPLPQELRASLASTAPGCSQHLGPGMGPGDPGPWNAGPWAGPQDGHGATGAQQPTFLSSLPPPPTHTLTARAVQLRWGLSTSRAGGWAAALGLCLEPRGSLLLPLPALPEPGPCAACPPCPFVPKAGGGGRPTVPEAGHQP